ncbi:hypothetical protein A5719_10945 [Mycolicibacterium peregrinum]|uniref:acyl-CoA dehydrogenase family protein n=1 Tax=Mycolicibacterium peregrinum TaxID=43304 RepID=UPI0007E93672|nr:acyl-CoA dehydrogenase family protein [Mycolicibacterium peregrinum]OBF41889.1 hypothetical protein A5719_10945 [Mycolicibacterium peregrinum]
MTAGHSASAAAVAELFARSTNSAKSIAAGDAQWQAFVAAGFPWAAVPQERGGPDGAVRDAVDVVREIGRAAAAVPAGETDLLGDWLLKAANLPAVPDLLAVAPGDPSDDLRLLRDGERIALSGTANRVAWASRSGRFVAIVREADTNYVVCVPVDRLTILTGESLAGEPRDTVTADTVPLTTDEIGAAPHVDIVELRARGAAIRAVQIQGAVEAVVELVVAHCAMRKQFGRRLQDFQVVGHQLALMREQATLVRAAADLARSALEGSGSWEDAAVAKIVAGDAAGQVAKTAHQLHGAIGVSDEYVLHRYTRRLWAWRDEYGGESEWAGRLGARLVDRGPGALWPWLTASDEEAAI